MEHIIEIKNLSKSFSDVKAVTDLSFYVDEGQLFAFLGVNGAGKSTTISILCGLLEKDTGEISICSENIDKGFKNISKDLGVVFQNSLLDGSLSVKDNLKFRAALYGLTGEEFKKRLNELSKELDFKSFLNRPVSKLSGGQRRRADIARALFHKPKILILDEPTTGLDPQTRKQLWEFLANLRQKTKMTVILTTHYMEEAADADYVLIIDGGKIAAKGTPLELKNKYSGDFISLYSVKEEDVKKLGKNYTSIPGGFKIEVENTAAATSLILSNPEIFTDYEIVKGKMDDVFLSATGKKPNEEEI
mgnify:FL=1